MTLNTLQQYLSWGVISGFVLGICRGAIHVHRHGYLTHRMYRLFITETSFRISLGVLGGIAVALAFYLISTPLRLFWIKQIRASIAIPPASQKRVSGYVPVIFSLFLLIFVTYVVIDALMIKQASSAVLKTGNILVFGALLFLYVFTKWERMRKAFSSGYARKAALMLTGMTVLHLAAGFLVRVQSPDQPNILLIISDALRPDHLGCYGYPHSTSPALDTFAQEGALFEKAMSNAPWTKPSVGTLLTSLYPYAHKALNWTDSLADANLTMAEFFRNSNYSTYCFQTNPAITANHNFAQGFEHYHENLMGSAESVVDSFIPWIKEQKKPFFAYLHFMDTHVPYNAPEEFQQIFQRDNPDLKTEGFETLHVRSLTYLGLKDRDKQDIINLYDSAIRYFDLHFGRLLEELEDLHLIESTIIIVLSDHGEEFWEHGGFAHGHSLYQEVMHVPLLIHYPKKIPTKRIETFISLRDVFPTVLDLLNMDPHGEMKGMSLLPSVFETQSIAYDPFFFEGILYGEEQRGVVWNRMKLIENTGLTYTSTLPLVGDLTKYVVKPPDQKFEMYDLQSDFEEMHNLAADQREELLRIKNHLRTFSTKHELESRALVSNLERKRKDLESLGYIK